MTLSMWWVHTCTVQKYLGDGAYGPVWDTPVTVPCWIDAQEVLVQNSAGQEVTQRNTVVNCDITYGPLFAPQSLVASAQLGDDGVARVAKVNLLDSGSLGLGLDHVEATLI